MHNENKYPCDCTLPFIHNQPIQSKNELGYRFNCHNKRRQRLYTNSHLQITNFQQLDQTETRR
jgi:hypothetical protein